MFFSSKKLAEDPRGGVIRWHHVGQSVVNKAIRQAVRRTRGTKKVRAHTSRHTFTATRHGYPYYTIAVRASRFADEMVYAHVLKQGGEGVVSPLEDL